MDHSAGPYQWRRCRLPGGPRHQQSSGTNDRAGAKPGDDQLQTSAHHGPSSGISRRTGRIGSSDSLSSKVRVAMTLLLPLFLREISIMMRSPAANSIVEKIPGFASNEGRISGVA